MKTYWSLQELITAKEILRLLDWRGRRLSDLLEATTMKAPSPTTAQALAGSPEFVEAKRAELAMRRLFRRVLARLANVGLIETEIVPPSRRVVYCATDAGRIAFRMLKAVLYFQKDYRPDRIKKAFYEGMDSQRLGFHHPRDSRWNASKAKAELDAGETTP